MSRSSSTSSSSSIFSAPPLNSDEEAKQLVGRIIRQHASLEEATRGKMLDALSSGGINLVFRKAVYIGKVELVRELLPHVPNMYQGSAKKKGQGALHFAVANGDVAMVRLLLEADFYPNIQDDTQKTPLQIVPEKNRNAIESLLLQYGAVPMVDGQDNMPQAVAGRKVQASSQALPTSMQWVLTDAASLVDTVALDAIRIENVSFYRGLTFSPNYNPSAKLLTFLRQHRIAFFTLDQLREKDKHHGQLASVISRALMQGGKSIFVQYPSQRLEALVQAVKQVYQLDYFFQSDAKADARNHSGFSPVFNADGSLSLRGSVRSPDMLQQRNLDQRLFTVAEDGVTITIPAANVDDFIQCYVQGTKEKLMGFLRNVCEDALGIEALDDWNGHAMVTFESQREAHGALQLCGFDSAYLCQLSNGHSVLVIPHCLSEFMTFQASELERSLPHCFTRRAAPAC